MSVNVFNFFINCTSILQKLDFIMKNNFLWFFEKCIISLQFNGWAESKFYWKYIVQGPSKGFFRTGSHLKIQMTSSHDPPTTDPPPHKKNHIAICTDTWGMALRHSVVIESRNVVKTCFCLHIFWKDLGTNKFLVISGWVPGTPCWNLTGS